MKKNESGMRKNVSQLKLYTNATENCLLLIQMFATSITTITVTVPTLYVMKL
jgi:hypothetical protein